MPQVLQPRGGGRPRELMSPPPDRRHPGRHSSAGPETRNGTHHQILDTTTIGPACSWGTRQHRIGPWLRCWRQGCKCRTETIDRVQYWCCRGTPRRCCTRRMTSDGCESDRAPSSRRPRSQPRRESRTRCILPSIANSSRWHGLHRASNCLLGPGSVHDRPCPAV